MLTPEEKECLCFVTHAVCPTQLLLLCFERLRPKMYSIDHWQIIKYNQSIEAVIQTVLVDFTRAAITLSMWQYAPLKLVLLPPTNTEKKNKTDVVFMM